MVGFLEENIGADADLFQFPVIFHGGSGDVHIDPADSAVFMLDGVDGLDAFQNILDGVVDRIFTGLESQTLVAHILQSDDLPLDFLLGQLFPGMCLFFWW